jgi:hypothetical protein
MPDTLTTITHLINSPPGQLAAGAALAGIVWKFFERVEAVRGHRAGFDVGGKMLVRQFKFKRNNDKGSFQWTAESEIERPDFHRGFYAVGKTLADVKEFAALVRFCERTGSLERLSEMHPPGWEKRMQTTWGGNWNTHSG